MKPSIKKVNTFKQTGSTEKPYDVSLFLARIKVHNGFNYRFV